ncbi:ABC transporter ATP-binding protein [Ruminococcaceae bacterium OttesenSCG-928-D13]|nr:ABC transporter ATP-binding protein [Ruminococcaceae bacterium OttesenSCG-928-D13]
MTNNIEIKGLCKQYPNFKLDNVSFNVPAGSIVGFVGENGAGKTTTIKAILDVARRDAGTITLMGRDNITDGPAARQDVGVVFDEISFHDWLRAPQIDKILGNIYKNWDSAYFFQMLGRFGLSEKVRKGTLKTFSRGMKMKLSLAAALAHHPKLLVLDEATSGLDPVVRDEILDIFLEFIGDEGNSILFSSHITSDIEKAADYLVFIHQGRIVLNAEKDLLLANYGMLRCDRATWETVDKAHVKGMRDTGYGIEALIDNRQDFRPAENMVVDKATVDDIMLLTIKGV